MPWAKEAQGELHVCVVSLICMWMSAAPISQESLGFRRLFFDWSVKGELNYAAATAQAWCKYSVRLLLLDIAGVWLE